MIDSHCHFDFEAFEGSRETLLNQCAEHHIHGIILPGVSPQQWRHLEDIAQLSNAQCSLHKAAGLHPWWVADEAQTPEAFKQRLQHTLAKGGWVAVGECGLDGKCNAPMARQLQFFEVQLQVACDFNLPLILHGFRAHNELLQLLGRYKPAAGGVIHGFSGSVELARQYWRLGFYIGVGGTITYERAQKTRRALAQMPLESLLLETDAPDMPPAGQQGQANSPLNLAVVAASLAELRAEPLEQIVRQTEANTRQLFAL